MLPSSATEPPLSADSMPRIVLASVDLPEPDSPTMPSVSPSASCRSTSTSAGTSVLRCLNVFDRLVSSSTSGLASDGARIAIGAAGRISRSARGCARSDGNGSTGRLGRPPGTTGGTTVRQRSSAKGQRSTNTQVGRSLPISGRMPGMVASARSVLRTPCRGSDRSSPTVYGCCGLSNTWSLGPSSTIRPAYITPTRSHSERMIPRLWAISSTAALLSWRSVRTRSSTSASTVASRPVVGSSSTRSLGSQANAMAMTTRCCMPPDSWNG